MEHNSQTRQSKGAFAGWVGVGVNLALFAFKMIAGLLTGAVSVTADAFNNLSDAAGSLVTLIGFRLSAQRADQEHPFGHGRMEYLAGLGVSLLILLVGVELARDAIVQIVRPERAALTAPAAAILALTILVKAALAWFDRHWAKKIGSPTLDAAAADAVGDALATGAVLIGLALTPVFGPRVDGVLGLAVALLILRSGWTAAKGTVSPLLGEPPDPSVVAEIEALILSHREIRGVHDLIIHDYGPGRRMMSVHAEVPEDSSFAAIHGVVDHIERELKERFGLDAVIHMDPVGTDDPQIRRLRELAEGAVRELHPTATVHDFRAEGADAMDLRFDAVIPYEVELTDEEIRAALTEKLREREPRCRPDIGVDRSYVL